jgi:hypothetical protein
LLYQSQTIIVMLRVLIFFVISLICSYSYSQSTTITPGNSQSNIQTSSTKGGIQFPQSPFDSIKAITTPVAGTVVFDSDNQCLRVFNGTAWQRASQELGFAQAAGDFRFWQDAIPQNPGIQFATIQTNDIVADTLGHLYVCGQASGNFQIGGNTVGFTPPDAGFIAKYSKQGTLIWIKRFIVTDGFARPKRLAFDASTNTVVVCGDYVNTIQIQGISSNLSITTPMPIIFGAFLAKFDANGNGIWLRGERGDPPSGSNVSANDITIGTAGDIYFCGSIRGSLSAPSGTVSSGDNSSTDILLFKYGADGSRIWGKDLGSNSTSELCNGLTFKNNKLYITGSFGNSTVIGATSLTGSTGTSTNAFLARTNVTNGDAEWAVGIIGGGNDAGTDIVITNTNDIVVTGNLTSTTATPVTFGTITGSPLAITTSNNSTDLFLARYTEAGTILNTLRVGGSEADDVAPRLNLDRQGEVYFAACSRGSTLIGGVLVQSYEGRQALFCKFDPALRLKWHFMLNSYTNAEARGIAVTPDGWVFGTGIFSDIATLNHLTRNAAQGSLLLVRYRD